MKSLLNWFILAFFRTAFWFRYSLEIKGLEKLDSTKLPKRGGLLVLPNHPTVFIDPTLVVISLWKKHRLRPLVIDYMYYQPLVHWFMQRINALPVPNFSETTNSLKKKRGDEALETLCQGLRKGENFMVYPAGRLKNTGYEQVGGTSAAHRILQEVPEANVILVRTTGLWGSSFSRAATGKTPPIGGTVWRGIKKTFKNFLFFMPRRKVTIEYVPAPPDFPYQGSKREINDYLEKWYNAPFPGDGEPLSLVSYSLWGDDFLSIEPREEKKAEEIDLDAIPKEVEKKVREKLALLTEQAPESFAVEEALSADLGLDSLDVAELSAFLKDEFDVESAPANELTTVGRLLGIAAKKIELEEEEERPIPGLEKWNRPIPREVASCGSGNTILYAFLDKSYHMPHHPIVGDPRSGILTYRQLRMRVLLLANAIRKQPGKYIGVMLPASVAAYASVLAIYMAGKIPLMVNWTVGPRHLQHVQELSGIECILTAWSFVDRLENIDFGGLEEKMVMLEDVGRRFSLLDKLKAVWQARRSVAALFSAYRLTDDENQEAVLLFTSGTESAPKGVPLTHKNILSNQRSALDQLPIYTNDVLLGILPPFHAFGYTVTGILPLLWGIRIAYSPDPTNGKEVSRAVEQWHATIICGTPTFLRGIFKQGENKQLETLRIVVTGAEKAPPELFEQVEAIGKKGALLEGYGITECSPVLTMNRLGDHLPGVGRPLPGVEITIVDLENHHTLSQGERGLILVRGDNIFSGYFNGIKNPFLEVDGKRWYNTGDLGFLDPETGSLIISGRLKRFIKVGGEMVSLAALESSLAERGKREGWVDPSTFSLAVIGKESPGERPQFDVVTTRDVSLDHINVSLRDAGFSNLVRISEVHKVDEIPVMGSGKIHYRQLEEMFFS